MTIGSNMTKYCETKREDLPYMTLYTISPGFTTISVMPFCKQPSNYKIWDIVSLWWPTETVAISYETFYNQDRQRSASNLFPACKVICIKKAGLGEKSQTQPRRPDKWIPEFIQCTQQMYSSEIIAVQINFPIAYCCIAVMAHNYLTSTVDMKGSVCEHLP